MRVYGSSGARAPDTTKVVAWLASDIASNGTYLPEQLPWLRSVEAGDAPPARFRLDADAPRPEYYCIYVNFHVSAPKV